MVGLRSASARLDEGLLGNPGGSLALRVAGGIYDGRVLTLSSRKCTIGAAADCTLRLQGTGFDAVHCLILRGTRGTVVRRYSRSTQLNGAPFGESLLVEGDRLTLGPLQLEVLAAPRRLTRAGSDRPRRASRAGLRQRRLWKNQRRKLQRQLDYYAQRLAQLAQQRLAAGLQLEETIAQVDGLRQELLDVQQRLADSQQQSTEQRQQWDHQRQQWDQERQQWDHDRQQWDRERQTLAQQTTQLQSELLQRDHQQELSNTIFQQDLADLRVQHAQLQQQLEQALHDAEAKTAAAERQIIALEETLRDVETRLRSREEQLEQERSQWNEQRQQLAHQAELNRCELNEREQLEQVTAAENQQELADLRIQHAQLQQQHEQALHDAEAKTTAAERQIITLEETLRDVEARMRAREEQLEQERTQWNEQRQQLAHQAELNRCELNERKQLEQVTAAENQQELADLRIQHAQLQAQHEQALCDAAARTDANHEEVGKLQDALRELEAQLNSREQQYEQARHEWAEQRQRLADQIEQHQAQLNQREHLVTAVESESQQELADLRVHYARVQEQLAEAEEARRTAVAAHQTANAELTTLQSSLRDLQAWQNARDRQMDQECAQWTEEREQLEAEISRWQTQLSQREEATETAAAEAYQELADLRLQLVGLQQRLQEAECARDQAEQTQRATDERAGALETTIDQLREQLAQRSREAADQQQLTQQLPSQNGGLAGDQQVRELEQQCCELQQRLEAAQRDQSTLVAERDALEVQSHELRALIDELQTELDQQRGQRDQWLDEAQHLHERLQPRLPDFREDATDAVEEEAVRQLQQWETGRTQLQTELQSAEREGDEERDRLEQQVRKAEIEVTQWRELAEDLRRRVDELEEVGATPWQQESAADGAYPEVTAPEPPDTHDAPVNTLDVLKRYGLQYAEDVSSGAEAPGSEQTLAAVEPVANDQPLCTDEDSLAPQPTTSAEQQPVEAVGDEESIEDYMTRLLQRVRGDQSGPLRSAPTAPIDPVLKSIPRKIEEPQVKPSTAETPAAAQREYIQRVAPEKSLELSAMRDLANNSARSAIDSSQSRQRVSHLISKLTVTLCALLTAIVLLLLKQEGNPLMLYGAAASSVVAICWSLQAVVATRRLLTMRRGLQRQPATGENEGGKTEPSS